MHNTSGPMEISSSTNDVNSGEEIDEGLYSRQLYVMGREAQSRMAKADVFIYGLNGLGVESAKNVILAGVKSVTLHDDATTEYIDLSSQFYLNENNLGMPRAQVTAPKLAELNPYVPVSVHTGAVTPETLSKYAVVLLIGVAYEEQVEISNYCHSNNIAVIIAETAGVYCTVFNDFGPSFTVYDDNGEPSPTSMVASITKSFPAVVATLEDTRHNLSTGDVVSLTDIKGMTELNDQQYIVSVKDPFTFEIPVDSTHFRGHASGGYVTHIKQPVTVSFDSYAESFKNPKDFVCDFNKFDRAPVLHLAFRVLHVFKKKYGFLPEAGDEQHSKMFIELCEEANGDAGFGYHVEDLKKYESYLERFALCCKGQCNPIAAMLGGIVGQEVLKACSGKFMPIKQWYYFDAVETLSDTPLPKEEVTPIGCRYDGQIMIFGRSIQKQLHSLNMFLVGAGAIGCEMIKNWALMGIACDGNYTDSGTQPMAQKSRHTGMVHITDMDHIERSNLSRQFLFRNKDINQPKSTTAANAAVQMNSAFRVKAYETKVAPDTENIFGDDFFEHLDGVSTALDNVEARLYIDQKCLFYHKPMYESGTLGAKGNTQVVIPYKTEHYGATRDPPEKSIPVCTLKHFPNAITHTLQWAREWFEEQYKQVPEVTNQYLSLPPDAFKHTLASQQNMKLDSLSKIKESLVEAFPTSIQDCLIWARMRFEDLFCHRIKQLLIAFPIDKVVDSGVPFWSGAKRPPKYVEFDVRDPLHVDFVVSSAKMRAEMFQLQYDPAIWCESSTSSLLDFLSHVKVPEFTAQSNIKIPTTEEEAKQEASAPVSASSSYVDVDTECNNILEKLPSPESFNRYSTNASLYRMNAIEFDKDSDMHMRVVAAASNLRARNYAIKEADLHTSRGIAGKITPAIATTTGFVAGTICLEMFKYLQNKPVESYMNVFTNLALPLFTSMEPEPPKFHTSVIKGKEWKWSQWDRIDIAQPGMKFKELVTYLEKEYELNLSMLSAGVTILYSDFLNKVKKEVRMDMMDAVHIELLHIF